MVLAARDLRMKLTHRAVRILMACALSQAVVRGCDYIALPENVDVANLGVIEGALPLDTWGWFYLSAGASGLVGMVVTRVPIVFFAHVALTALYAMFGVGALVDIVLQGHWYGWRTGGGWILVCAVLHAILAKAAKTAWEESRAR